MKRIIISHETRQLFRSGAFRSLLLLVAGGDRIRRLVGPALDRPAD